MWASTELGLRSCPETSPLQTPVDARVNNAAIHALIPEGLKFYWGVRHSSSKMPLQGVVCMFYSQALSVHVPVCEGVGLLNRPAAERLWSPARPTSGPCQGRGMRGKDPRGEKARGTRSAGRAPPLSPRVNGKFQHHIFPSAKWG